MSEDSPNRRPFGWALERPRIALALILALAVVLRLGAIAETPDYRPSRDSIQYDQLATSVAHGNGFPPSMFAPGGGPTAFRPPAYPYMLGAVYAVTNDSEDAGRVAGAFVGTATVALVYVLGGALWGTGIGLLSGLIAAIFPPLVLVSVAINSEVLFLPVELAAVAAAVLYRKGRGGNWLLVCAGVASGLAALTRPNGWILLVPVLWAVWGRTSGFSRARLTGMGIAVLATALTVLPWSIRNTIVFDSPVPLNTATGPILAGEYNDTARDFPDYPGTWLLPLPQVVPELRSIYRRDLNETELDRELTRHSIDHAVNNPGYVVKASVLNALRTFELAPRAPSAATVDREQRGLSRRAADLDVWTLWGLCLVAMVGIVALARRAVPKAGAYVWSGPILLVAAAFPVLGQPRYRVPVLPFIVLLAAIGVVWLANGRKSLGSDTGDAH